MVLTAYKKIGKYEAGKIPVSNLPVYGLPIVLKIQSDKAGRVINLFPTKMKVFIENFGYNSGDASFIVNFTMVDGSSNFVTRALQDFSTSYSLQNFAEVDAACKAEILIWATNNSYTLSASDISWTPNAVAGLTNAPQAAIADAPADAKTDYNVVTTLLGTLTSAVNTSNTKQNDIATKLNSLFAKLRTLGLISA